MNINEVSRVTKRVLLANLFANHGEALTPIIQGPHGIGKSQCINQVAKAIGGDCYTIEATVMKEGEITGLPFAIKNVNGKDEVNFIPYYVIAKIQELEQNYINTIPEYNNFLNGSEKFNLIKEKKVQPVIIFIDELNRTDSQTMKELMNIILNRNVNGYNLPWWCFIAGAINPAGSDSQYATNEFDDAQADRFFIFECGAKLEDWVDYMLSSGYDTDIVEAVATSPECFMKKNEITKVEQTPSPRGWAMVASIHDSMNEINNSTFFTPEERKVVESDFFEIAAGKVGATAARTMITAMKNAEQNIKPEEIFTGLTGNLSDEVKEKLSKQKVLRAKITMDRCVRWMCDNICTFRDDKSADGKKKYAAMLSQISEYISMLDGATKTVFAKKLIDLEHTVCNNKRKEPLFSVIASVVSKDLINTVSEMSNNIKEINK